MKLLLQAAMASEKGEITLETLKGSLTTYETLIPSVQIFKEIMVELLKGSAIDMEVLREERRNYISEAGEASGGFQLNEMLLNLADTYGLKIKRVEVYRIEDGKVITFEDVPDETGRRKKVCCSNVLIRVAQ